MESFHTDQFSPDQACFLESYRQ